MPLACWTNMLSFRLNIAKRCPYIIKITHFDTTPYFFSGSLCGAVGFHFNCYKMRKYFYALIIFKVKIFRSQMRGVRDRDFFIFRLVKLYA